MVAAAAFALMVSAASAVPSPAAPLVKVVVRQQTAAPLPPPIMHRIAGEVREVWRRYVDVQFGEAADLRGRLPDDTLTLVVTDDRSLRGDGLGWIEFVDGEPVNTITASLQEARRLAEVGVWSGRRLRDWPPSVRETFLIHALGRGIAHEIGHYLLRSKAHEREGLMRARFTVQDLMDPTSARYRLGPDDVRRLQERFTSYLLARRARPEPAAQ